MNEAWQDEELAKADIRRQERLAAERMPWETTWAEIDERFPNGAGGFRTEAPGNLRGGRNYDVTHIIANKRFAAAGVAITTPEEQDYIKVRFADPELNKLRSVELWRQRAGKRLRDIRHAMHTGFAASANEDWDQLGRYGTSAVWQEAIQGRGLFYRTLHLSTCWIDTDMAGLVNVVHRKWRAPVREIDERFGRENLTPKMLKALEDNKPDTEFEILHVVAPNTWWDEDKFDHRRFPIASRFLALEEKLYIRRAGFHTMPVSVSRHTTSPGEKYGRSPAIDMAPAINGLNAMRHTVLRAAHKAVDPALIFNNDDGVTKLVTRAGGLNPGLVSDDGRPMVHRMPGGEAGLPYAENETERERQVIRTEFLEEFYKILTDPNSRMTTTEVLEVMAKQGVLVRPYANRYAAEKQHPMTNRDLDLAMRAVQLDPFPPEVEEAGAWPIVEYENPLAAMARAESTARTMRFVEYATAVSGLGATPAADTVDIDAALREGAAEIGVKPSIIRDPKAVEQLRAARAEAEQAALASEALEQVAGATLDFAKAGQVSEAA